MGTLKTLSCAGVIVVGFASSALAASAGGATDSTQHVTLAVADMARGAGAQLDALNQASDAVQRLAEESIAIGEAAHDALVDLHPWSTDAIQTALQQALVEDLGYDGLVVKRGEVLRRG